MFANDNNIVVIYYMGSICVSNIKLNVVLCDSVGGVIYCITEVHFFTYFFRRASLTFINLSVEIWYYQCTILSLKCSCRNAFHLLCVQSPTQWPPARLWVSWGTNSKGTVCNIQLYSGLQLGTWCLVQYFVLGGIQLVTNSNFPTCSCCICNLLPVLNTVMSDNNTLSPTILSFISYFSVAPCTLYADTHTLTWTLACTHTCTNFHPQHSQLGGCTYAHSPVCAISSMHGMLNLLLHTYTHTHTCTHAHHIHQFSSSTLPGVCLMVVSCRCRLPNVLCILHLCGLLLFLLPFVVSQTRGM